MASSSAGRIDLDLELNYGQFQRQLGNIAGTASGMVGSAFKGLGGIIAGAFAVKGLVDFGKEAIELASNLQEVQNVVDVTFGSMAQDINNWSKTTLEQFGLSELTAKRYSSTLGAMMKSSGLAGVQMETMSKRLTELSADMASFYNLSTDDAFEKIRSGISGETEPLKQLGVNMSVANMEAYALSQGIKTSWNNMDQASQTLLRYNYLLSVTGDAQGDFARTSGSWANQVRLMGEQWKIFQGTMGAGFINILTPILKGLNWLIAKLQIAAAYFKAFTELIFGNAASTSSAAATTTAAIGGMGDTAAGTAGSMGDLGKATDDAGKKTDKAGKKVKGALAGFDQLNTLSQSAADAAKDAGDAAGGLAGLGAGIGDMGSLDLGTPDVSVDPIKQKIQALLDGLKGEFSNFWSYVADGWAGLGPALKPFVDMMPPIKKSIKNIGDTFEDLKDGVLTPVAGYILGDFIPSIVIGFAQSFAPVIAKEITWAFNEFDVTFRHVTDEMTRLWNTVWLPSLDKVKNAFLLAMPIIASSLDNLLTGAINPFVDFMLNGFAIPITATLTETLVPLFADTLSWAIMEFAKVSQTASGAIVDVWQTTLLPALEQLRDTFLDVIPQIGDSLDSLLNGTIKPFVDYAINDFIIPIAAEITKTLVPIFADTLTWAFKEAADVFDWAVGLINDIYKTVLKPVFDLIKEIVMDTLQIIQDAWDKHGKKVLDGLSGVMDSIKKIIQRLWDEVLKPIIEPFLATLKELWEGTFKGIAEQAASFVLKLIEYATVIWNKVISPLINAVIDMLAPSFVKGFNIVLNIVKSVIESIGGVIKGVFTVFNGLIDFLIGVFTGDWKRAWEGVKTIFKGVFDSLYSIVKLPLNLIIDAINTVINGLNKIQIDMPEWAGGKSFGVDIKTIPHLAKGGLAYGPTLAMVGDNRGAASDPEVVSPLSKLQGMLDTSNSAVVAVLVQILEAVQGGDRTTVIKLGETELGRAVIKAINNVQRQAGRTLLDV